MPNNLSQIEEKIIKAYRDIKNGGLRKTTYKIDDVVVTGYYRGNNVARIDIED